jgi:hypothetical protein
VWLLIFDKSRGGGILRHSVFDDADRAFLGGACGLTGRGGGSFEDGGLLGRTAREGSWRFARG